MIINSTKYPFKYMHNHPNGCRKVAFYFVGPPIHGNVINAQEVVFPDGSHPKPTDHFKCGSCRRIFQEIILEHVERQIF